MVSFSLDCRLVHYLIKRTEYCVFSTGNVTQLYFLVCNKVSVINRRLELFQSEIPDTSVCCVFFETIMDKVHCHALADGISRLVTLDVWVFTDF